MNFKVKATMRTVSIELDESDIRSIISERYGAPESDITISYTEECVGYGTSERNVPKIHVQVTREIDESQLIG